MVGGLAWLSAGWAIGCQSERALFSLRKLADFMGLPVCVGVSWRVGSGAPGVVAGAGGGAWPGRGQPARRRDVSAGGHRAPVRPAAGASPVADQARRPRSSMRVDRRRHGHRADTALRGHRTPASRGNARRPRSRHSDSATPSRRTAASAARIRRGIGQGLRPCARRAGRPAPGRRRRARRRPEPRGPSWSHGSASTCASPIVTSVPWAWL